MAAEGLVANVLRAPMMAASDGLGAELVEAVGRV
jgi:4-hydroxy-tetrahydrodipicolinate synthase